MTLGLLYVHLFLLASNSIKLPKYEKIMTIEFYDQLRIL